MPKRPITIVSTRLGALAALALFVSAGMAAPKQPAIAEASAEQAITIPTFRGDETFLLSPSLKASTAKRTATINRNGALLSGRPQPGYRVDAALTLELTEAQRAALTKSRSTLALAPIDGAPGFYRTQANTITEAATLARTLRTGRQAQRAYVDVYQPKAARALPNDPLFSQQWHLINTVTPSASINAPAAWSQGFTGSPTTTIGIIDQGSSITHPDLLANYNAAASQITGAANHSTACAGLAAGVGNNTTGITGVAYTSRWSNMTFGNSNAAEAAAFGLRNDLNSIKSNSWGPFDDGTISYIDPSVRTALATAATTGRDGLGTVFFWAAGNGGTNDNSNYDPYASSRYVISVGAVTDTNQPSWFTEPSCSTLVVAPSSGGSRGISTTSWTGTTNAYTSSFGGTSAACPIAAGVGALVLQANPRLTWRDVQHVFVGAATQINPADPNWLSNAADRPYHDRLAFGLIDAGKAVTIAKGFAGVGPEVSTTTGLITPSLPVPGGEPAGVSQFPMLSGNLRIEHVELTLSITCDFIGDLRITLTSPSGTVCDLARPRFDLGQNYNDYTFTISKLWDEPSEGVWTLKVISEGSGTPATLNSYTLTAFGNRRCVADLTGPGGTYDGVTGTVDILADGQLTIEDFIVFLSAFTDEASPADLARIGGGIGPDAQLTIEDFIMFLAEFSNGCE